MTDAAQCPFRLEDAPMALDRTDGWAHFREAGDVFFAEGIYFLTSAEAVQYGYQHPQIFSSAKAFDIVGSPVPLIPLAVDPPEHVRYRRILDPMLAPRVVNDMEDELRRQINELIDAFAETGHCDIVADVGKLYPTQVFLTLFGMPLEDRDRFAGWVHTINDEVSITGGESNEAQAQAGMALFGYLQAFIAEKRKNPGDDMLSRVITLEGEGEWTDEELLGLCFLFTLAGLDTVTGTIGFMMMHMAKNPELRRRVVADPSLAGPAIEEILRLELPAPLAPRIVMEDIEIGGVKIPKGSMVQMSPAAANRDPRRFDNPDEIDLDNADRGHFAFGGGIHRCLGSHLARRELRLVLEEFHKRIPEYELAEDEVPRVTWPAGTLSLQSLRLKFPPAGPRAK